MSKELPFLVNRLIDAKIPDLSIHYVECMGWQWTFRCTESETYFDYWEDALIDFVTDSVNSADSLAGVNEE